MSGWTLLEKGIEGAEGPVFDQRGRLFVVEPPTGRVLEIIAGHASRTHAQTGGMPAGLMVDAADQLWVADMQRGILKINEGGQVQVVVGDYGGEPIRGCNDLVFDERGHLFFTAPAGSGPDDPIGEVFCRRHDGEVYRIDSGLHFPNGIAVSPDGHTLIVAETWTKRLWSYRLDQTGRVCGERTQWATLSGQHWGGPDGIDFDFDGRLLATNWGAGLLEVFDPAGACEETIALPFERPSNLHFGGEDGRDLIVTEHTNHAVWRGRWRCRGLLAWRSSRESEDE